MSQTPSKASSISWQRTLGLATYTALLTGALSLSPLSWAQQPAPAPAASSGAPAPDAPCCGPITPAGERLTEVLDSMHVEQYWMPHVHIEWETGKQDRAEGYSGPDKATHCSAFAAAVGKNLNVYMLRPPEHKLTFLASAQTAWFHTDDAKKDGWFPVSSMAQAQMLANLGNLVVIAYESPDEHKPGHIVVVRPSMKTQAQLDADGPEITQAGAENHNDSIARLSFVHHAGAWPNGVRIYAHTVTTARPN